MQKDEGAFNVELFETALRVLAAWNRGSPPEQADINVLQNANLSSEHLRADELACAAVLKLTAVLRARSEQKRIHHVNDEWVS